MGRRKPCEECLYVNEMEKYYLICDCCDQKLCRGCWEEHNGDFKKPNKPGNGQGTWRGYDVITVEQEPDPTIDQTKH